MATVTPAIGDSRVYTELQEATVGYWGGDLGGWVAAGSRNSTPTVQEKTINLTVYFSGPDWVLYCGTPVPLGGENEFNVLPNANSAFMSLDLTDPILNCFREGPAPTHFSYSCSKGDRHDSSTGTGVGYLGDTSYKYHVQVDSAEGPCTLTLDDLSVQSHYAYWRNERRN